MESDVFVPALIYQSILYYSIAIIGESVCMQNVPHSVILMKYAGNFQLAWCPIAWLTFRSTSLTLMAFQGFVIKAVLGIGKYWSCLRLRCMVTISM